MGGGELALVACAAVVALAIVAAVALLLSRLPPPPEPARIRNVRVGGRDRTFLVYTPPGRSAGAAVLLAYPGSGETAEGFRRRLAPVLERLAREQAFVVAYLQGFENHFNDCRRLAPYGARKERIDDVAFTRAVLADLESRDGVDPRRVFALGFSNGGHMAFRLALEAPDLVEGIVAVAANLPTAEDLACQPVAGRLPAVVLVEGDRDPINPYRGGRVTIFGFGNRGNVLSAEESERWFAARGSRVLLIPIAGGGHTIPQAAYRYPRILGMTKRDDGVLESALRFVQAP
jgi:polyhydroxybutyrate depolymerase